MKNGKYVTGYVIEWYQDGKLHREDGPAKEHIGVSKEWYRNGKLHREDGPAVITARGTKYWFINGMRHREDGPAVEMSYGSEEWWLNDQNVTEEKFQQLIQETQLAQETQNKLASNNIDIDPDSVTFDMIEQCSDYGAKLQLIESYGMNRYWNEKTGNNK